MKEKHFNGELEKIMENLIFTPNKFIMKRIKRPPSIQLNKKKSIENNLRQYLLYVFLHGEPEPIYAGSAEWERVEGFGGAYLEIKY